MTFPISRLGKTTKRGVEFRHSTHNTSTIELCRGSLYNTYLMLRHSVETLCPLSFTKQRKVKKRRKKNQSLTCCCIFVSKLHGLEHNASTISKTLDCNGFLAGTFNAFKLSSFSTRTAKLKRFGNIGPILVFVVRSSTAICLGFFLRFNIAKNISITF